MAFTFPKDTANKAGAVKTKTAGASFVVPTVEEPFDAMEVKRVTLTANTDSGSALGFSAAADTIDIQNLGTVDAFVAFEAAATVNGATCILIPASAGLRIPYRVTTVHAISTGTPAIQVIGFRNNP